MNGIPKNKVRSLKRAVAFGPVYAGDAQQLGPKGFDTLIHGPAFHTPETKQKISAAIKQRHARSRK